MAADLYGYGPAEGVGVAGASEEAGAGAIVTVSMLARRARWLFA
jgi:hypothetical protein